MQLIVAFIIMFSFNFCSYIIVVYFVPCLWLVPLLYYLSQILSFGNFTEYSGRCRCRRTYINGPPNPTLNLPAHLCSITYIIMYFKTRKMVKLLIRSKSTFMMGWLQRRWISKNNYPKGASITEQNVAGWWTINLSYRHRFFCLFVCFVLFLFFVFVFVFFSKKRKQANLLQKPYEARDRRHTDIH